MKVEEFIRIELAEDEMRQLQQEIAGVDPNDKSPLLTKLYKTIVDMTGIDG